MTKEELDALFSQAVLTGNLPLFLLVQDARDGNPRALKRLEKVATRLENQRREAGWEW